MKAHRTPRIDSSLTEWEWAGLDKLYNLADGHAHLRLSAELRKSLGDLTELFELAEVPGQEDSERQFLDLFFALHRQTLSDSLLPPLLHYSSSVSIDIVAKTLTEMGRTRVGLLTPTFDNIPLILQRQNLKLVPIEDDAWEQGSLSLDALSDMDAVFLVIPNNPTGCMPSKENVLETLRRCAATDTIFICDFSFRMFADLQHWDQYAAAAALPDLKYIFLEDTGKTWPARELKVGLCTASADIAPSLRRLTNEVLLNVSPFTLGVLSRFIRFDVARVAANLRPFSVAVVGRNRTRLRRTLKDSVFELAAEKSSISVEWLRLPNGWTASPFASFLVARGVSVLPGSPFYWDCPARGERLVRVALMRDNAVFAEAADALLRHANAYRETVTAHGRLSS